MSYDDSFATEKDEVRFLIGDTEPSNEALSDAEINYLLGQEGSVKMAAAQAALTLAAQIAKEPSFAFGTFEMSQSEAYSHFIGLAEQYSDEAGTGSGLGAPVLANPPEDDGGTSEATDWFSIGDMDIDPDDPTEEL